MTDICERARIAYDLGIDPIDYAEQELTVLIAVHLSLMAFAAETGLSGPELATLSLPAMSRRIIGSLLDAGWTAPEVTK